MQARDITFEIVEADGDLADVLITTPHGTMEVMCTLRAVGRTLYADRLHVHGSGGAWQFGPAALRVIADAVMERLAYDELCISGAARTTGAGKGRIPAPIRFRRRPGA